MFRRPKNHSKLLFLSLAVVSLGALLMVWGYSSATVSTDAKVSVIESKDALVAVDIEPVEIMQGDSGALICGLITNNLPNCIWNLQLYGGFEVTNAFLDSGNSTPVLINLSSNDTLKAGYYTLPGRVLALWDGGEAEIDFEVPVQIIEQVRFEGVGQGRTAAGKRRVGTPGGGDSGDCSGGKKPDVGSLSSKDNYDTGNVNNPGDPRQESGPSQVDPDGSSDENDVTDSSVTAENEVQDALEVLDYSVTDSEVRGGNTNAVDNNNDFNQADGAEQNNESSDSDVDTGQTTDTVDPDLSSETNDSGNGD